MLNTILSFHVPEIQSEPPQPQAVIEFTDPRLNMRVRANIMGGYTVNGEVYLTVQPIAQRIAGDWFACDLDDTAFPVSTDDMLNIEQVR